MRIFWGIAGILALLLGMMGAILPLLPTVPFMLFAAFCFARSSERLHQWLLGHRIFGPGIRDWRQHGAISSKAKRLATVSILLVGGLSLFLGLPGEVLMIQGLILSVVLIFIWSRPTGQPKAENRAHRADPGNDTE